MDSALALVIINIVLNFDCVFWVNFEAEPVTLSVRRPHILSRLTQLSFKRKLDRYMDGEGEMSDTQSVAATHRPSCLLQSLCVLVYFCVPVMKDC